MVRMVAKLCVVLSGLLVASLGGCGGGGQATSPPDASTVGGGTGGFGGTGGGGTGGQRSTATGATPLCIPGASVACACVTGQTGAQTCTSAGIFAACVCAAPAVDAGNLGETGGTTTVDASSGTGDTGGQVASSWDAPTASTGGVDALDTGGQVVVMDGGMLADVGPVDAVYVPTGCGDGIVVSPEQCDDGNTFAGDGCSPTCKVETGHKCSGSPSRCTPTTCGDGKVEGAEGCDDGNTLPFDGCSEDCQIELDCSGASCTSQCGDGIVVPPEQCDDGNTIDGDGCSKNCRVEAGWICTQPSLGDKMMVPVIYRDFRFHNPSDFEAGVVGLMSPQPGAVNPALDQDGKPVFSGLASAHIASTSTFAEWYRDVPGVNHTTASKMPLWDNGKGGYANRYGANGEQWNVTETAYFCGIVGEERLDASGTPIPCTIEVPDADIVATDCTRLAAKGEEMLTCYENNGSYSATFLVSKVDGNPLFFPVDNDTFTPASELRAAQIPPFYDPMATWPFDLDAAGTKRLHNFSFTSEVRYWFLYDKTKTYILDFVGDDDVWVFINKKLAVDLGGVHTAVEGSVKLDATTASSLGLVDGNVYEIAVFQAERQSDSSSFKLTLGGFNAAPSDCTPCGDASTAGDGGCSNETDSPADAAGPI